MITINRAIEVLKLDKTCEFEGDADELREAIQLGIEALKREKEYREYSSMRAVALLPGEALEV